MKVNDRLRTLVMLIMLMSLALPAVTSSSASPAVEPQAISAAADGCSGDLCGCGLAMLDCIAECPAGPVEVRRACLAECRRENIACAKACCIP